MPTYAYRCQNCGAEFEKVQKFADKPVSRCPVCSKGPVRRLFQPSAIVFKGSGWYATDNRSPSGNGSKSEKSESSEKGDKAEKRDTADKGDKSEKTEKSETAKASKAESDSKPAKKDGKASSGTDSASSG